MIKESSNVFYIHGLYGSSSSRKFKFIKERYPSAVCLEWKFNDNIEFYLENTFLKLSKVEGHISLIGSSTGGNFAWQIQQKLLEIGKECELILINPLLDLMHKYDDNFPNNLERFLKPMSSFTNTSVIISLKDEVLNSILVKTFFEKYNEDNIDPVEIIFVESDHRITNFDVLLEGAI